MNKDNSEAEALFDQGQALLREAAQTGDPIVAMRGRSLCHRAIELRWYEKQSQGQIVDPPWVRRKIDPFSPPWSVNELGKGGPIFVDELDAGPKQLELFS